MKSIAIFFLIYLIIFPIYKYYDFILINTSSDKEIEFIPIEKGIDYNS